MADGYLNFDTKINTNGMSEGLSKLAGMAKSACRAAASSIAAAGGALAGLAAKAVQVGTSFEASMSQVAATMGITAQEIAAGSKEYEILARAAKELQLEGFILSDYRVAALLHALLPEAEIHTSCNAYQWNLRQMEIWREKCGATVFNPPRESLRTPSRLKEMHDAGFRLKCLVNEACLMGCPNSFNHNLSIAMGRRPVLLSCCQNGIADLFRANWILPRWQKHYDDVVDIYKIAGRNTEGDYPFKTLDAYLAEDDSMPLAELMISGTVLFATHMLPAEVLRRITVDKVPDKLLTCECRECEGCGLCERILSEIIPEKYRESFRFKIKVT